MKRRVVVVVSRAQRQEVLCRARHILTEDLNLEIAQVGVQGHRHDGAKRSYARTWAYARGVVRAGLA